MTEQQSKAVSMSQQHLAAGETEKAVRPHNCRIVSLTILNVGFLIAVFIFNGLGAQGPSSGVFDNTVSNQSRKYRTDITPAGWTFSIWGFIYAWQALWVLYSVLNLFRKTPRGPAYVSPPILPPVMLASYVVSSIANVAWLFVFDRDHIQASCAVLVVQSGSLIFSLGVSYKVLDQFLSELVNEGRCVDIWLVRGLVHNGLGIYATWVSVAALLNLGIALTYTEGSDVSVTTGSTIVLGILTGEIVCFVCTDLLLLDRYSRYTFTPYVVVIVALVGSISKNWESGATNSLFSAVLLGLGSLAFLVKGVLSIYRHLTRPPYRRYVESTLSDDVQKNVV